MRGWALEGSRSRAGCHSAPILAIMRGMMSIPDTARAAAIDESIAVADFLTAARVYYLSALAVCGED